MKKTRTYRVKRIIRNTFAGKLNIKMGNHGRRCILRSCVAAFVWDFYNVNHLIDFFRILSRNFVFQSITTNEVHKTTIDFGITFRNRFPHLSILSNSMKSQLRIYASILSIIYVTRL